MNEGNRIWRQEIKAQATRREDRQPWKFLAQVMFLGLMTILFFLPVAGTYLILRWVGILG